MKNPAVSGGEAVQPAGTPGSGGRSLAVSSGEAIEAATLQTQYAHSCEEPTGEVRPFLEVLRRLLKAPALAWLTAPGETAGPADCLASARPGAAASLIALRSKLESSRAQILPAPALGADGYLLSTPVTHEGRVSGWLVAQMTVANQRDLPALLVLLQSAAGYLLYQRQRGTEVLLLGALEKSSGLLEVFRRAGSELDFERACRQAVDGLREEFGCSRVVLARCQRRQIRLLAISGLGRLDWKSSEHQPIEAAMREALREGGPLNWTPDSPSLPGTAAHELLAQQVGADQLLTLPLPRGGGAVLLEWVAAPQDQLNARAAVAAAAFVPVLCDLLVRARPPALLYAAHRWWSKLGIRPRTAVALLGAALLVLLAWPFHYTLQVGCRLAPVTKRVVAAPFQGQLRRSLVRPGDRVVEGQPLGELDNRELKLKEAELLAARDHSLKQRDRALANQGEGADFATAQVADFEAQSVSQELALVQQKLALLTVRAPLAGTIVSGDLRRAEGAPLQQGQVLWEVAPLEEMIVELEVPDRDVSHIRTGQPVAVHLEAFTSGNWQTQLERVHPQSEAMEGRNIFIGEAPLRLATAADLRPGMRGRASIETERRPLAWILGHRLWEWVVTALFW